MKFVLLALVVEALITNVAWALEGEFNWKRVAALLIAPLLAFLYGIDLLEYAGLHVGYTWAEPVGYILTGMLAARGSNAAADLLTLIMRLAHEGLGGGSEAGDNKGGKEGGVAL